MTAKLILGSSSPRRCELLRSLGVTFDVTSPNVEEVLFPNDPVRTVTTNAEAKFAAVAGTLRGSVWALTADTIVCFEGACYLKPASIEEATSWFRRFSARSQEVFTGLAFGRVGDKPQIEYEVSTVWFKMLDDDTIGNYFRRVNPLDKAGGYDINADGDMIIDRWEGSKSNIMGLPLDRVRMHLQQAGLL